MTFVQVQARAFIDQSGTVIEIPVLLSEQGPLLPLVDYLLWRSHDRSPAWMRKVVQAVRLLMNYMEANAGCFEDPKRLFNAFAQRLYLGSVGPDGDPSGLYWPAMRSNTANVLLGCLAGFSEWLVEHRGAKPLSTTVMPSGHDERLMMAAWEHRRSRAFLGHALPSTPARPTSRSTNRRRTLSGGSVEDAVSFPERHFMDLLVRGFVRHGYGQHPDPLLRLSLRDILITLLMHGAGLRMSECFHLWVHDVQPDPLDPTVALVRVHHPSEGDAPDDWLDERGKPMRCNRAAYLAGRYGRRPRHEMLGTEAAGWKNPALDGRYYLQAYWFPRDLGRLFLRLWNLYLLQLVQVTRHHPYAFVVLRGPTIGDVYGIEPFKQAHRRAIERIGLEPAKALGTTPHGHRHAFGRRLMRANVEPVLRKKALHHRALSSQAVYTAPSVTEVSQALDVAAQRLDTLVIEGRIVRPTIGLEQLTAFGFKDIDPDELLSGPSPKLLHP